MTTAEQRRADPERVKAFTDGVFAIIITILVLEIGVPPELPEQSLRDAIVETGPELLAWVISFFIVGMYWVWHRDLFNQVRYVNRDVVWLNLLFMMPAALIPFAASVLGEYHDEPIALHLYGAVLIATSLLRWLLYGYSDAPTESPLGAARNQAATDRRSAGRRSDRGLRRCDARGRRCAIGEPVALFRHADVVLAADRGPAPELRDP